MIRTYRSEGYNYNFNIEDGYFERWGKTLEDDPQMSPIGPEILDIEVSTICHTPKGCFGCYKSNTARGKNMTLDTFKIILDKMPSVMQIAFGIGDIDSNLDLFPMMEYARSKNVVPNITINGDRLTNENAKRLVSLVGAIAVSHYSDENCFNAVNKLTSFGLKQCNIHQLVAEETYDSIWKLLESYKTDSRLAKLGYIVFLSLKRKGRGIGFNRMSDEHFTEIVQYCINNNIRVGFDSCGASKIERILRNMNLQNIKQICQSIEPCESSIMSSYLNVEGKFFPCSFAEGCFEGIDVVGCNNFLDAVWYNPKVITWREGLLNNCRNCPLYEV